MHRPMCFCMLAVVSVFISMSSTFKVDFEVVRPIRVHVPTTPQEQSTQKTDEGDRRKRRASDTERSNIVNTVNSLRSSVGSSNMNYLTYSTTVENEALNWTRHCNYDAVYYGYSADGYVAKHVTEYQPDYVSDLEKIFDMAVFYKGVRSVYLQGVGAATSYCSRVIVDGESYTDAYLSVYSFSATSNFNENLTQFNLGKECTTCKSRSFWCYEKLCRDDCSSGISTCSCYSGCKKCQDWDRKSCTCPSQPLTDAVTLECYNRGEMTFKAGTSVAIFVLSTLLVLIGLQ